ncbi:MAG TPA: ABC transporter ATP-binding protein [Nitrososphaerales archaeon]|nr:ABC transporter ATP-binding protein [Nitrososphaerales archaeon]
MSSRETNDLLVISDLEGGYGDFMVLRGVTMKIGKGELVSLIGPNGAGKSTLLKTIIGILRPKTGRITFQGHNISRASSHFIVSHGIAYVPQGLGTFPQMSVYENLEAGAFITNDKKMIAERMNTVFELFPRLKERLDKKAYTLSGGERQMLLIGRALMQGPDLILLDEPSLGLDPRMQIVLSDTIRRLHQLGKSILLVEQNIHVALEVADRCYVMEFGRITHQGTPEEFSSTEKIKQAYLGI